MKTLGEIFEIGSGGTPSKTHPEYYDGNIPWVKTGDLKDEYLYSVEDCISEEGLNNSSAKMYPSGTVLIAMYGATIGATSILKFDACTNQACAAFKPCEEVLPEYLYFFLRSKKQKFISDGVGGAQPNISAGYLKKVSIDVRNIKEQEKIVTVLDKLNGIIQKRQKEIDELDELIKARFVEMFGDPVLNPKGFPVYRMDEVVEFQGGSQPNKKYFEYEPTPYNIRLIQIRDYKTDNYITYIPKAMAKRFCTADDIMIGRYGPPIFQVLQGIEGSFNVALMKATPKMGRKEFVRYFLKQDCLLHYLEGMSKRTAGQDGIQMDKLKSYPFPMPPLELQEQFESFVAQVDKSKVAVQSALDKAQLLFDSLMQEYFG
jgi:type I restriction enzyme S subunit